LDVGQINIKRGERVGNNRSKGDGTIAIEEDGVNGFRQRKC
jgi:hypothetical protein